MTVTGNPNVSKVREIIEPDGRYTIHDIGCWHIPIAGAFHLEAYFESMKDVCQMEPYMYILTNDQTTGTSSLA